MLIYFAHSKGNFFKLFVFDTGLLGALSRLRMANILRQDDGSYKGYYAENFVAQEFHALGWQTACWREGQAEVEFLCEHEGRAIPVEVKSGQVTQFKSLASFQAKYQPPCSFLLSGKVPRGGIRRIRSRNELRDSRDYHTAHDQPKQLYLREAEADIACWLLELDPSQIEQLAIDGKVLRGTGRTDGKAPLKAR